MLAQQRISKYENQNWPPIHTVVCLFTDHRTAAKYSTALCRAPYFDTMRGSDLSVSRDQFKTHATKTAN